MRNIFKEKEFKTGCKLFGYALLCTTVAFIIIVGLTFLFFTIINATIENETLAIVLELVGIFVTVAIAFGVIFILMYIFKDKIDFDE